MDGWILVLVTVVVLFAVRGTVGALIRRGGRSFAADVVGAIGRPGES